MEINAESENVLFGLHCGSARDRAFIVQIDLLCTWFCIDSTSIRVVRLGFCRVKMKQLSLFKC